MVIVDYNPGLLKKINKIKEPLLKEKIKKQIAKIIESPESGKPMRYARKGTREVYIPPFHLAYVHLVEENKIAFFGLYHKDSQ